MSSLGLPELTVQTCLQTKALIHIKYGMFLILTKWFSCHLKLHFVLAYLFTDGRQAFTPTGLYTAAQHRSLHHCALLIGAQSCVESLRFSSLETSLSHFHLYRWSFQVQYSQDTLLFCRAPAEKCANNFPDKSFTLNSPFPFDF